MSSFERLTHSWIPPVTTPLPPTSFQLRPWILALITAITCVGAVASDVASLTLLLKSKRKSILVIRYIARTTSSTLILLWILTDRCGQLNVAYFLCSFVAFPSDFISYCVLFDSEDNETVLLVITGVGWILTLLIGIPFTVTDVEEWNNSCDRVDGTLLTFRFAVSFQIMAVLLLLMWMSVFAWRHYHRKQEEGNSATNNINGFNSRLSYLDRVFDVVFAPSNISENDSRNVSSSIRRNEIPVSRIFERISKVRRLAFFIFYVPTFLFGTRSLLGHEESTFLFCLASSTMTSTIVEFWIHIWESKVEVANK